MSESAEIELPEGARVLAIAPNWLGDVVMAEPVLRVLSERRPDLEITVQAPAPLLGVFRGHPGVKGTLPVEASGRHGGLLGRFRLWSDMRAGSFDAALLLRNSFGAALDASRAGIPVRVGFSSFPRSWFLTHPVPFPEDFRRTHRTGSFLRLLGPLGVELGEGEVPPPPQVTPGEEARAAALELLNRGMEDKGKKGERFARPLIAIHPGAAYGAAKMWGETKFADFADRFVEEHGATVVFLGSPAEKDLGSGILGDMRQFNSRPGAARNLAGETPDLESLAALLSHCDLVLGNDSGPVHLAGATGVRTIALFGSTSSDFTGVRGRQAQNIWEHLDCSPCFKRECPREDYMACMDAIPVARAYTVAAELLGLKEPDFEDIAPAVGDTPSTPDPLTS